MDTLTKFNHITYEEISFGEEIDKGNLIVYKGVYNNNIVAIKEYQFEDNNVNDLLNELQIGTKVRSERMLKVIGYSITKENIYLIMEYLNSTCLWDFIDNEKYYETVTRNKEFVYDYQGWTTNYIMTYELKKSIIISVLKSIKSMYNDRIIHGDLKTPNLVVHKNGDEKFIKVIDYGSCYYGETSQDINIDRIVGTDGYYAPEQIDGLLNHKSDIYSTGVIITEVYVGKIWKGADNFNSCRNELLKSLRMIKKENPKLEKLIRKSIDLDHKKRPDIYKLYDDFIKL